MNFACRNSNGWILRFPRIGCKTRPTFAERLRTQSYDVIVCDYSMPNWTGWKALELLNQANQEIPFILATSVLEEATMDAFIRKGRIRLH